MAADVGITGGFDIMEYGQGGKLVATIGWIAVHIGTKGH